MTKSHASSRHAAMLLPLGLLLSLALPASAFAQATRTWVSGLGDDANPCSRTAPCKTFPGAYSKTAVGGVIDVIDPGGFGTITIGHSITIDGGGEMSSILASSTVGITINAGATDHVILRNLDIDGVKDYAFPGTTGIKVNSVGSLRLDHDNIYGFSLSGLDFQPTTAGELITARNTEIHDNGGDGVRVAPAVSTSGWGRVTLRNSEVDANACGVVAGGPATTNYNVDCGTTANTPTRSALSLFGSSIGDSANNGVEANGTNAVVRLSSTTVSGSGINGLTTVGTGSILSFGNNPITGNNGTETISSTIPLK